MLISTPRYKVSEGKFWPLPRWLLAPLSLNEGHEVYITSNKYSPTDGSEFNEIILSPFPKELWGDLWRIQLQVTPGVGRVAKILEFLASRKLKLLACEIYEGGSGENTVFGSAHIIVSAMEYESYNDGGERERIRKRFARLPDLYDDISTQFIDELNFLNRRIPRLNIRRLAQHHILSLPERGDVEREVVKTSIVMKGPEVLDETAQKIFNAKSRVLGVSHKFLRNEIQWIMPTTDSYERVLRIIPLMGDDKVYFLEVVFKGGDWGRDITTAIGEAGGNIIKYQYRSGVGPFNMSKFRKKIDKKNDVGYSRLSITFQRVDNSGAGGAGAFWGRWEEGIKSRFGPGVEVEWEAGQGARALLRHVLLRRR